MKKILNKKLNWVLLIAIIICISIASLAFVFDDFILNTNRHNIFGNLANTLAFDQKEKIQKPKYFYSNQDLKMDLKISAKSYLVGDLNTGEVILAKNTDEVYPIASVSKLMTALVAKEINTKNTTATVSKKALATYGSNGGFRIGEKIKINDLLYPLLLESSNDSAEIIAEHFNRESFIEKLNTQAKILKMEKTTFADPSGLSEKNLSSVGDLFKLAGYIKDQNPEILEITKKRSYSNNKKHTWYSNNQFLHKTEYLGGKSGYTDKAKETVISVFDLKLGPGIERPIAITLLQSNDRARDVETILKYLKKNVYYGGDDEARVNWIEQNLNLPDIRDPDFITFSFLGDIMLDRGVRSSVNKNFKSDYSSLFDKMSILKESDIVFANFEGVASDKGKDSGNLYSFNMDPSVIPALRGAGINILSVANNHSGDWGRIAYIDTLSRLKENEILYTGGGTRREVVEPTIIEKYDMKIGFLGFSDVGPHYMKAEEDATGVLLASNPQFEEIIKNASLKVDYLIVSFHFGDEYKKVHNARQESLSHRAIDNGAKIVIGHHPHVIQDTEVYKNGFIAYSLGNFIFDQRFSTDTMQGMLLNLKLSRTGNISIQKNIVKLNRVFQPDRIIFGKEEQIKFK